jgi:drug/metabolite transporter (DMT)-like permease
MKIAVNEVAPLLAVWLRNIFSIFVIIPAVRIRGEMRKPFRDEVVPLMVLALLGILLQQNIQFTGMQNAGVANSSWMMAGTPAFVAILGWIFLKEKLGVLSVAGLIASGIGVFLVIGLGTKGLGIFSPRGIGDLLIAASVVNWAVFQIFSRHVLSDCQPAFSLFWMNIFALIIQSIIVCFISPQNFSGLIHVSVGGWCATIFLGCVCTGLGYILWYDGLSVLSAARVSAFQFLQPVLGVAAAYLFAGERFTYFIYIGGALIVGGVWMVNNGKD